MPDMQRRNDEMSSLLTADLLTSDDRNVCFSCYDAVGQTFTTVATHAMATVRLNTAPTVFSWDGTTLTIAEAGLYLLSLQMTLLKVQTTAVAEGSFWIEQDATTGLWGTVVGASADLYLPIDGRNSSAVHVVILAGAAYRYRTRVARNNGADTLGVAMNGSMFNVVRLYRNP